MLYVLKTIMYAVVDLGFPVGGAWTSDVGTFW